MKFIADMGISQATVHWLRERGLDAIHVRDEGMHRAPDTAIVERARADGRVILTCDLDFPAIMSASGERCPSVIIIRLEIETPANVNRRLTQVLEESYEALLGGAIVSVEETRHRVRLLPV